MPTRRGPTELSDAVDPELARIVARALPGARILRVDTLGNDALAAHQQTTEKAVGYGIPIRIDVEVLGAVRTLVVHGTSENAFGHDRRADRAAELLLAADTFATIPRHTRVLDVGAFRADGSTVSLSNTGEFYLLTDYANGRPYAEDLRRIARTKLATANDLARVDALADYLLALHVPVEGHPFAYQRSVRDLLGSGEGIFGIIDAYGQDPPGVELALLKRIEERCWQWRWAFKARSPRLRRIHGDFHPFNILFDDQGELHVLDTSRGSLGDAADDVACLAVNFVFFAIDDQSAWNAALATLWTRFWNRYSAGANDARLLSTVAPFLAWRLLVLACPVWYPNQSQAARRQLLNFAETALAAERFEPNLAQTLFTGGGLR